MSMNLKDDILKADADGVDITKNNSLNTDVVKVVRCKDCKYKIKYDNYNGKLWCNNLKKRGRMKPEEKIIQFVCTETSDEVVELSINEFKNIIKELKKLIPKKPEVEYHGILIMFQCPVCCNFGIDKDYNFCPYCGQALDWGIYKQDFDGSGMND